MKNPFKGLESYKEHNCDSFFGRENDISYFYSLVLGHTFTVLTGKSGLGKTSLLQAGLYPRLRNKHILPIPVRLDLHADPGNIVFDIHQSLIKQINSDNDHAFGISVKINNKIYPVNMGEKETADKGAVLIDSPDLKEWNPGTPENYFKDIIIRDKDDSIWIPCIVFDQFEEVFTAKVQPEFLQQLQKDLIRFIESEEEFNSRKLTNDESTFKLIISLREDYFAQLTQFLKGVNFKNHAYYRILPLNGIQAKEIIGGPDVFDDDLQQRIIAFFYENEFPSYHSSVELKDLEIEPTILSILCTQTFDIVYNKNRLDSNVNSIRNITDKDINQRRIIEDYFTRLLTDFSAEAQAYIEDHLITKGGSRTPFRLDTHLSIRDEIEQMEKKRLIKKIWIGGKEHIELIHDVVAPIIKDNRDHRRDEMDKRALEEKLVKEREQRERVQIQQSWTLFVSVSAMIIFTVLLILMFKAKETANEEREIAEEARAYADQQALIAESARDSAEVRRIQAEQALLLAESQRNAAIQARQAETEAKNIALSAEEMAKRRKLRADELAYLEKRASVEYQILNKEIYAQQLFTQSEKYAVASLSERDPLRKRKLALDSYYTILSAIYNDKQATWIDSLYKTTFLPQMDYGYITDSARFQALEDFQNQYRRIISIDETYPGDDEFVSYAKGTIYNEYSYIFNALMQSYINTSMIENRVYLPKQINGSNTDIFLPLQDINTPIYFDLTASGIRIDDYYLTGISHNGEKIAYAASSGRILINNSDIPSILNYNNDGNSILKMNFLDDNRLIISKIRSNTKIISFENNDVKEEINLDDNGNIISIICTSGKDLFTLDDKGGFWHWKVEGSDTKSSPEEAYHHDLSIPEQVTDMTYNPISEKFIFCTSNGDIYLLTYAQDNNPLTEPEIRRINLYENKKILEISVNHSADWLATSTMGSIDIWKIKDDTILSSPLNIYSESNEKISGLSFDKQGHFLFFGIQNEIISRPVDLEVMVQSLEQFD